MPKIRIVLLLCLATGACLAGTVRAEQFRLVADSFPPYVIVDDNVCVEGISAESLLTILNRAGLSHSLADVEILPWARALEIGKEGPRAIIIDIYKSPARANSFKWVGPVDTITTGFIARKDKRIRIDSPADFASLRIGALIGGHMAQLVEQITDYNEEDLTLVAHPEQLVQMLMLDRIDIMAYSYLSTAILMQRAGMDPTAHEGVFNLETSELYFAFSLDTDDALIEKLQAELDAMKRERPDGGSEYTDLVKKHLKTGPIAVRPEITGQ